MIIQGPKNFLFILLIKELLIANHIHLKMVITKNYKNEINCKYSYSKETFQFNVSKSTVCQILKQFQLTGNLENK